MSSVAAASPRRCSVASIAQGLGAEQRGVGRSRRGGRRRASRSSANAVSATATASPVPRSTVCSTNSTGTSLTSCSWTRLGDVLGAVADDHHDAIERQQRERVEHVQEHRTSAERVQHLGRGRAHARALARGEHHCATPVDAHRLPSHSLGRCLDWPLLDRGGQLGGEVSNLDLGLQRTPCCRYTTPDRRGRRYWLPSIAQGICVTLVVPASVVATSLLAPWAH